LCEAGCGLDVTIDDGAVTLIRGDRSDVFSGGYLCPKGTALKDLQYDPDRLRRPLVKRHGTFVEVGFDEAFAEVERRLMPIRAEHGPASCGLVIGNPTVHRTGLVLYALELATALGSPNVFSTATLDQMPKHLAVGRMFGDYYSIPVPDIERTNLLVVIGANPIASNGSGWTVPDFRGKARALRQRGGRLVTIDPRFTETSRIADRHHYIRPGSDVFLLAAMVRTLFEEGLVRLDRLAPFVNGVDKLRPAVEPFAPEQVAPRCGIAPDDIRGLARDLRRAPRAALYGRLGTCLQRHGTLASWLIDVINALTGHLDAPGGAMFPKPAAFASNTAGPPGIGQGVVTGRYHSRVSSAPEVMGQFPMACLAEEIDTPGDGQIRSLIMMASNAAISAPNSPRLTKALDGLEFMVCLDIYVNETTRHADVIIPGPSPLEEAHYDVFFSQFSYRNTARYSPRALPPPAGLPRDWETMLRLIAIVSGRGAATGLAALDDELTAGMLQAKAPEHADAMLAALAGRRGPERLLDLALRTGPYGDLFGLRPDGLSLDALLASPSGIDLGPLEPRVPEVLRTPSGKIELAPPDFLGELAAASGEIHEAVPECVVIGRRDLRSNNSWMHNLPVLASGPFRCTLLVHPADAARWRLVNGGRARLSSPTTGEWIEVTVEIDASMMAGVVSLPHGWGHDQTGSRLNVAVQRPGVNVNVIADSAQRDRLSGTAVLNGFEATIQSIV
jgi:anaerobic selenocysteine-containing dehydrogenase